MLLPQKEVESFPVVEVEIAERRERLQAAAGLTVGKIRESFQVPIDWTAVLGEELVADNYPILRDCFLLFRRRSVGEAMAAGVCGVIRAQGCCLQREDDRNWIAFNELYEIIPGKEVRRLSPAEWELLKNDELLLKLPPEELETLFNGELRMLSEKALKSLLNDEGIRNFNPIKQRLVYHCGDYCRFVLRRIRQREEVLDAAADPKAIVSGTAALSLEAGFVRRLDRRKKGGK